MGLLDGIFSRKTKLNLKAVYDDDLIEYLDSINMLDEIKEENIECSKCGDVIGLGNIGAIYGENDEIRLRCGKFECLDTLE